MKERVGAVADWVTGRGTIHIILGLFATITVMGFGEFYAAIRSEGGTSQYVEYADDAPALLSMFPVFGVVISMVSVMWLFLWLPDRASRWGKRKWRGTMMARLFGFLPTATALAAIYWLYQAGVVGLGDLRWLGILVALLLLFMLTPWYKKFKQKGERAKLRRLKEKLASSEEKSGRMRVEIQELEQKIAKRGA